MFFNVSRGTWISTILENKIILVTSVKSEASYFKTRPTRLSYDFPFFSLYEAVTAAKMQTKFRRVCTSMFVYLRKDRT